MMRALVLLAGALSLARSDVPGDAPAGATELAQSLSIPLEPKIEFHARDLSVADALGQLRRALRKSVVVAGDVKQRFSGDLCDLTAAEAVQAICRSVGLTARDDGTTVYVGAPEIESRTFHVATIRAEEMAALVQGALSSRGSLVTTDASAGGATPNQGAITVFDYPRNLSAVAELLRAFDASRNDTARDRDASLAFTGGAARGPIASETSASASDATSSNAGPRSTDKGAVSARTSAAESASPADASADSTAPNASSDAARGASRSAPAASDVPRDAERLSRIYVEIAGERLEHREPDAALLLLDAARALGARDASIDGLRRRAARALIATSSAAAVDASILNRALGRSGASSKERER